MGKEWIVTPEMAAVADEQQAAALDAARRNAGRIYGLGPRGLLELFAAIGDLMEREPGRRQRDDNKRED